MINDQGGVNGRKINLIQYDDAYSPPKAVEQVRKLVESRRGAADLPGDRHAVQCRRAEISEHQEGAATVRRHRRHAFTDPKNFPWTMGYNPNYQTEGRIYGQIHPEELSERQDRHPLAERRSR